jgi:outer membrane protein W
MRYGLGVFMNIKRKSMFLLAGGVLCSASFMAAAQQAEGPNQLRLGLNYATLQSGNSNGSGVFASANGKIDNGSNVTLGYQRFLDKNVAVGIDYGFGRARDVSVDGAGVGGAVGSVKTQTLGLSADYYFIDNGNAQIRPYAGVGLVHTKYNDGSVNANGQTAFGSDASLSGKSTTGLAARLGADFKVADSVRAYVGASWEPFTKGGLTLANSAGSSTVDIKTQPFNIGAGVGFSF